MKIEWNFMLLHKNNMTNKYFLCSCYNINMNTYNEGKRWYGEEGNEDRQPATISNIGLSFRVRQVQAKGQSGQLQLCQKRGSREAADKRVNRSETVWDKSLYREIETILNLVVKLQSVSTYFGQILHRDTMVIIWL